MHDLIISDRTVVDGTGTAPRFPDITAVSNAYVAAFVRRHKTFAHGTPNRERPGRRVRAGR